MAVRVMQARVSDDVSADRFCNLREAVQQLDVVLNLQLLPQERQGASGASATLTELFQLFLIVSELLRRANVGLEKARLLVRDRRLITRS